MSSTLARRSSIGTIFRAAAVGFIAAVSACGAPVGDARPGDAADPVASIEAVIEASGAEVGLFYRSLGSESDSLTLSADVRMHAASTMKVPVMMQLFLDHERGVRSLDSTLPVARTFRSIVDGSPYDLPPESDSDSTLDGQVGDEVTVRYLIERMITWSSSLATNILIEVADPSRIEELSALVWEVHTGG